MLQTLIRGAIAGTIATAPMTVTMATIQKLRPAPKKEIPPERVTERIMGAVGIWNKADKEEKLALTGLGHFAYGAVCGAIYAPLARRFGWRAMSGGIGFGLLVWFLSYQTWVPWLGIMRPATNSPTDRNLMMSLSHVVWGAATGLLLEALENKGALE